MRAWYHDAKTAEWKNSNDLKMQYKNTSIVGDGRVVFNIKGNDYRLAVALDYELQVIFIRFIGNHKQLQVFNMVNHCFKVKIILHLCRIERINNVNVALS